MTKPIYFITMMIIAALAGYGGAKFAQPDTNLKAIGQTTSESAYDRVMRTKELRCGYNTWPPAVALDANTGKVSGFVPDLIEQAAASIGIKVVWTQQAGWSSFPQDLQNKRFDAMCAGAWALKEIAPFTSFTRPIFYNPVYAYVRKDDTRFDADFGILNNNTYKIGAIDGAISSIIAKNDFPQAAIVGLPQLSDPSQVLTDLAYKKSDVVFMEAAFATEFMQKNPNTIRPVSATPYRSFPSPLLAAALDDAKLVTMFDTIIGEMQLQGTIERTLQNYHADPALFILPNKPYTIKP